MPLFLDDEQTMLRDTARDFIAEHAPMCHLRGLRDANDPTGFPCDLWKGFAEMGFTGILIGEEHGGLGLGHVEAGVALAIDEGPKHRDRIVMTAERAGNGFRLRGAKQFVAHGHVADLLIVAPRDAAGLSASPERLADSSLAARLTFEGVAVDADAVIGEVDAGSDTADEAVSVAKAMGGMATTLSVQEMVASA